jgi:DNA-binding beta-propeller fold protein YncE
MRSISLVLLCSLGATLTASAQHSAPLTLTRTIALKSVAGRFDHFAFDPATNRLFVAATGNHSIEIVNVSDGEVTERITGLGKPHGLAWIDGKLFVADGTLAALNIYSGSPLKLVASLPLSDDADDMVYDPGTRLLYVGHGGSSAAVPGRVAVVNAESNTLVANLPTSAHPEALEIDPEGKRIFVNVADSAEIAVIDGATHTIAATWKLTRAKDNVPVAYDADDHALLIGCRTPPRAVSLDSNSGKEISDLPSATGADDLFYEPSSHRAYLISGSGNIDVYQVASDKSLKPIGSVKTGPGAKTGLLVSSIHSLFVAVPADGAATAQVRVYNTVAK